MVWRPQFKYRSMKEAAGKQEMVRNEGGGGAGKQESVAGGAAGDEKGGAQ